MPDFGPFKTAADAVFAACPLILSKPHAVAGRKDDPNFDTYFRISTEYCGLLYYTPDEQFEMSMLAVEYAQNDPTTRHCPYVSRVEDPRYPPQNLKYIYMLHNHAYDGDLSNDDISSIVALGREHGFEPTTATGNIRIAVIAFFSNGAYDQPTCDGFFEYVPLTGMIWRWARRGEEWSMDPYRKVVWTSPSDFRLEDP